MKRKQASHPTDRLQTAWQRVRQAAHRSILKSSEISRGDRELLARAGRLRKLMKGWYCLENGGEEMESPAAPAPGVFFDFLGLYLEDRLGSGWCLSAESSLHFRLEPEVVPERIIVLTDYGSTTNHRFFGLTELTVYHDPDRFPEQRTTWAGLRLMSADAALGRLKPSALERDPELIRRSMPLVRDWDNLSYSLATEGRHTAAVRLAEELDASDRPLEAAKLRRIMSEAGFRMPGLEDGTDKAPPPTPVAETTVEDPALQRLRDLWTRCRNELTSLCPAADSASHTLLDLLAQAQEKTTEDALHSLALSGFSCSRDMVLCALTEPERAAAAAGWPELREQEKRLPDGHRDPLAGEADPQALLALQGYVDAARLVKRSIVRLLEDESPARVFSEDMNEWHRALLGPSVEAGFVSENCLGVYRSATDAPVKAIAESPAPELVPAALDVLWKLAEAEKEPSLRAQLAHLGLIWIHPWQTGNGRMARFVLNALLTADRQPWLVITGDRQECYREYLENGLGGSLPRCLVELAAE